MSVVGVGAAVGVVVAGGRLNRRISRFWGLAFVTFISP